MEQVRLLAELDVPLEEVLLSHTDKVPDPGYHRDLLATGVNLEYDQLLRQPSDEPHGTAWLTATMVEAGYVDQLMLGTDGARRTLWTAHGGSPGLAWMLTGHRDVLARHGLADAALETMLVANPARWLSFDP